MRLTHPEECIGKDVFTPDGRRLGPVLDVSVYSFARVKQLLVETAEGLLNIDSTLIETVEPERILLKEARPVSGL